MKRILIFAMFLLVVQNVYAKMACDGTVYLELPDNWNGAYAVADGVKTAFSKSKEFPGWYELQVDDIGALTGPETREFFIDAKGKSDCENDRCITREAFDVENTPFKQGLGFSCSDIGGIKKELWIQENPDLSKADVPYFSTAAANVKYLRIFLPNNMKWRNSVPMIQEDGKPGIPLESDPDQCGWLFRRYIDEPVPDKVVIYRDDDENMEDVIGLNGNWEENATATPIPLKAYFEMFQSNELFFVADAGLADFTSPTMGWSRVFPNVDADCSYELAVVIYDTDASLHGAFTCAPDWYGNMDSNTIRYNACYYANAKYPITSDGKTVVPCVGVTQGMVSDTLIPDSMGHKKPTLTDVGRKCFGDKADEAFAAMFNSTPGVNEVSCYDLMFQHTSDGMWEFNSDNFQSPGTPVSGGFYPVEKMDVHYLMSEPLPAAESKRKAEGPTFFCADNSRDSKTPDGLRTIDPVEGVPISNLLCNGPGWDGGIDCSGLFVTGDEFSNNDVLTATGLEIQKAFDVSWAGDGWGWSCDYLKIPVGWQFYKEGTEVPVKRTSEVAYHQWVSGDSDSEILIEGGRNQHFCLESHAMFRYRKGAHFSFNADDDIWVYIDNKLAVDLGGMHISAPGYVDVDKFLGEKAAKDSVYDIDIFYCDRRTKMTNLRIKTNSMFFEPDIKLKVNIEKKSEGKEVYRLAYTKETSISCFSGSTIPMEGERLMNYLYSTAQNVNYFVLDSRSDTIVTVGEMRESKTYLNGGINLFNRTKPTIDKNKLGGINPGKYFLVAEVEGNTVNIPFNVLEDSSNAVKVQKLASPGFRIERFAPLSFTIILDESAANATRSYAVLDMLGKVVKNGKINTKGTSVQLSRTGSYIVKVDGSYQRIDVK